MKDLENIKIALVSLQKDTAREPPFGLVYVGTYLRDSVGIKNIKIIDRNYSNVEEELSKFSPDIIGFGAMTVEYGKVIKFAKKIRNRFKDSFFILGGVHISSLPESFNRIFDVGIIGEGEYTFEEVIKSISKRGYLEKKDLKKIKGLVFFDSKNNLMKTPLREPIKEIDSLPLPDFKMVNRQYFKKEEIPAVSSIGVKCYLMTSRGCPYKCVFCSTTKFWGKVRLHSPDYTARLVKKAIEEFGATHIRVMDDLFTISPQRLRDIKKAFEEYKLMDKIKTVECQPRANLMTDELCKEMKRLKIKTINFGFESGSNQVLMWLKNKSVNLEMNKNAIIFGKNYGFNIYGSLMYGSPGETIEDMRQTNQFIDFALKHKAKHIWSFIATPFPDTIFWEIALERGTVKNDMNWDLLSHQNIDKPLLLDENINIKEFKEVFLEGRKKLRKLKIILLKDFIINNTFASIIMVAKEPKYHLQRIFKQIYKE